jgi:hypothetical protein
MKRTLALLLAVATTAALAAPAVSAAPATTAPGYNFRINVYIQKGGQVVMSRTLAKRGWLAHFLIHNRDTKKHVFDVGGLKTKKPIPPGGLGKVGAYLDTRGQYPYRVDGKIRGYFVVN